MGSSPLSPHGPRESYHYHGRASRLAAHPDLEHPGRAYDASREPESWSMDQARDLLAGYVVPRRRVRSGATDPGEPAVAIPPEPLGVG